MAALKKLVVTIIVLNLVRKGLAFYYTVLFTGPPMIWAIYSFFHRWLQSPRNVLENFEELTGTLTNMN